MMDVLVLGAGLLFLGFLFFVWVMVVKNYNEDKRVLKAFQEQKINVIPKHKNYV